MKVNTLNLVYFSPTQTTKKVLAGIAQGIQPDAITHLNLTPPQIKTRELAPVDASLAIIGAPVYGGRIPVDATERLRQVKGNGVPAVVVVVYGNRAYEDALLELKDIAVECGFVPIAGAAFIGEHSFSTDAMPIAQNRPDEDDLDKARAFGQQIREKMLALSPDAAPPLTVPGNSPYKPWKHTPGPVPTTHADLCTLCGDCADACPTSAITIGSDVVTDPNACILCCACTRACPTEARVMEDPRVVSTTRWLDENFSVRKEPEVFV
jgi:ferredoxin